MYDLIIKNVRIVDGTSAPWFRGRVAVKDGVIAGGRMSDIGRNGPVSQLAREVVDGGDCGLSVAPVSRDPEKKKQLRDYMGELDYIWETVGGLSGYAGGHGHQRQFRDRHGAWHHPAGGHGR